MVTVLIVDDEFLVRESIKKSVDWINLGFEIAGEAKDGKQALEMIDQYRPDILIADINLPFITGIELAAYAHERYPMMKTIIVTGYSEFEYAQKAIEAGVQRYLMKPIATKEFVDVLIKAQKAIKEERNTKMFIESWGKKHWLAERQRFFTRLISGQEKENGIQELLEKFQFPINFQKLCIVILRIDDITATHQDEKEIELWKFAVSNIAEEVLGEHFLPVIIPGPEQQLIAVVADESGEGLGRVERVCEKIRMIIKQHLRFTVSIGVGRNCEGYDRISFSYKEADMAVKQRFSVGCNQVFVYCLDEAEKKRAVCFNDNDKRNLLLSLRLGNFNEINEAIAKLFQELESIKSNKELTVFTAMNVCTVVIEFMEENGFPLEEIAQQDLLETLMNKETGGDVKKSVLELFQKSVQRVFGERNMGISKTVEKAKHYIEKQISKVDLSLEEIADTLFVNSSYLSTIFKQEMGLSVVEYINICRLNKSKEILDREIFVNLETLAYAVGYCDHYYFSKRFKKYFGLTPRKYLENKIIH